ncbi:hypothetical protein [Motiliproteus sp. MSK22-1]|uniref:hypothetical protein n=1 Tax=Motiliproteus sp. MSK22-1 TaxID=1897630 RepID=UPI00117C46C1|nr:hypothetical protein [Motiliproteus sp. MSK22-1]
MISEIRFVFSLYFPQLFYQQEATQRYPQEQPTRSGHRTLSKRYREKKKIVRNIWIAAGFLMVSFPLPSFIVTLGLFTTFLSFTILDESS